MIFFQFDLNFLCSNSGEIVILIMLSRLRWKVFGYNNQSNGGGSMRGGSGIVRDSGGASIDERVAASSEKDACRLHAGLGGFSDDTCCSVSCDNKCCKPLSLFFNISCILHRLEL